MTRIDLNSDMGEGIGFHSFGHDAELMPWLTSANIACGWHCGDPTVMRETVELALKHNVAIGAHVGFPDLIGFGLHRMEVSATTIYDWVLYQAGALGAFVEAAGSRLQHVKPHGALYYQCAEDPTLAEAVARATKALGDDVVLVLLGDFQRAAAEAVGVRYAPEGFVDLLYTPEIFLSEHFSADDPEQVSARAVALALEKTVDTTDGRTVPLELGVQTICIHGHVPGAGQNARRVRERLEEAGVEIAPISKIVN